MPAEYRFPSVDNGAFRRATTRQSDVDLRCLRMEFSYLPPYRGLDEQTKRTLRQSLSDVCDQMALQLLVVKSPISQDELTRRAATIQYPVPAAFEARRRARSRHRRAKPVLRACRNTRADRRAVEQDETRRSACSGDEMRRFIAARRSYRPRSWSPKQREAARALS